MHRFEKRATDGRGQLDSGPLNSLAIVGGIFLCLIACFVLVALILYCRAQKWRKAAVKGGLVIGQKRKARQAAEELSDDIYFDDVDSVSFADSTTDWPATNPMLERDKPNRQYIHMLQLLSNPMVVRCPKHSKKNPSTDETTFSDDTQLPKPLPPETTAGQLT